MYKKFSARTTPFPHSHQKNLLEQTPAEASPTLWYPPCCQSCSGSVGARLEPLCGSHWPAYLLLLLLSWFSTLHILRMKTQTRNWLAVRNSEPSKTISQFCPCILGPYQYITNTLLLSHSKTPKVLYFSQDFYFMSTYPELFLVPTCLAFNLHLYFLHLCNQILPYLGSPFLTFLSLDLVLIWTSWVALVNQRLKWTDFYCII